MSDAHARPLELSHAVWSQLVVYRLLRLLQWGIVLAHPKAAWVNRPAWVLLSERWADPTIFDSFSLTIYLSFRSSMLHNIGWWDHSCFWLCISFRGVESLVSWSLDLFHSLMVRKSRRVDLINTIDIHLLTHSIGRPNIMRVRFLLSTFISKNILIHQKVNSRTKLVHRIVINPTTWLFLLIA